MYAKCVSSVILLKENELIFARLKNWIISYCVFPSDEPRGAYSQLSDEQKREVRVLAGIGYSVRGDSRPTAGQCVTLLSELCHSLCTECERERDREKEG